MVGPQDFVVGYDGSGLSEAALRRALELAQRSSFSLVHVVTLVEEDHGNVLLPNGVRMTALGALEATRLTVATLVEDWASLGSTTRVIAHLRVGVSAQSLIDFAYRFHAEQILVGATGIGRTKRAVGRFAESLLDASDNLPVHLEFAGFGPKSAPLSGDRWAEALPTDDFTRSLHKFRGQLTLS